MLYRIGNNLEVILKMVRVVVFKVYAFIFATALTFVLPAQAATNLNLNQQDLDFLKAVKQETLQYIKDQKQVTEAFKICIERNICDAKFQMIDSTNLPFEMVFDNKQELLNLIRRLHTKFRILAALRNKHQYESIMSQGLVFLSPMNGLQAMRFTTMGEYGQKESERIFNIMDDDKKTQEEFKAMFNISMRNNYEEDYKANYQIELLAIETYETQMSQILTAIPMFNELAFAEVGRREKELSETSIINKMNAFLNNLEKTKTTVDGIAEDNVVDTFMFPAMVNQVLYKNPDLSQVYEKLSAYALARKNLFQSFIDKFTNTMTWALLGCFAGSIIVPKAAPLIMGICGGIGFTTMAIMAAKTYIEIDRINPLVRVGLVEYSNLSHLQSVLTHQLIMAFIIGSGSLPNVIKLASAQTYTVPARYYSQVAREISNKASSRQAWQSFLREHFQSSRAELGAYVGRVSKANAKDLTARVPSSAVYQAYSAIPKNMTTNFGLFDIFTLSHTLRLQMHVL